MSQNQLAYAKENWISKLSRLNDNITYRENVQGNGKYEYMI